MIGTMLRFFVLRVLGGRAALVIAAIGFLMGRRQRNRLTPEEHRERYRTR
ncbi:MAG: hypothetical protein H0X16_03015 [Chloroflexi bacterium]|nr:hypothetical protein [Chloroflexota bacterium]